MDSLAREYISPKEHYFVHYYYYNSDGEEAIFLSYLHCIIIFNTVLSVYRKLVHVTIILSFIEVLKAT